MLDADIQSHYLLAEFRLRVKTYWLADIDTIVPLSGIRHVCPRIAPVDARPRVSGPEIGTPLPPAVGIAYA